MEVGVEECIDFGNILEDLMTNDFQQSKHAGNMPQRERQKYLSLFIVFTLIAVVLQTLSIPSLQASAATVVLVGAGDIASCAYSTDTATAKLLDDISGTVFTTGDNVYTNGTYTQYKDCYGPNWGRHKSRTKPSPGNHEYNTSRAAGYFQYFNNILSYYAYNLGDWRIYALNSNIDVSATSAQIKWLKDDLAKNPKKCVLAYWHHPRWSSGAKYGNNSKYQTLWKTLYDAGAELVINGHEHHYERFKQMNASGSAVSKGLRAFVVGTGGAGLYGFGSIRSTSEVRNSSTHGVLKLTLSSTSYSWNFIPVAGKSFTDSGTTSCR
jgi:acid phosphatase type 7